ncbi:hypothetical protein [Thermoflexus sp.]|uniref:hypothetical protein n=1 Tax=Thermoflexus sp. TaxID=1969742 RepID=UPI002ADDBBD7|nr:hypothetical protein [Thermoflexus sp.]
MARRKRKGILVAMLDPPRRNRRARALPLRRRSRRARWGWRRIRSALRAVVKKEQDDPRAQQMQQIRDELLGIKRRISVMAVLGIILRRWDLTDIASQVAAHVSRIEEQLKTAWKR